MLKRITKTNSPGHCNLGNPGNLGNTGNLGNPGNPGNLDNLILIFLHPPVALLSVFDPLAHFYQFICF